MPADVSSFDCSVFLGLVYGALCSSQGSCIVCFTAPCTTGTGPCGLGLLLAHRSFVRLAAHAEQSQVLENRYEGNAVQALRADASLPDGSGKLLES